MNIYVELLKNLIKKYISTSYLVSIRFVLKQEEVKAIFFLDRTFVEIVSSLFSVDWTLLTSD